jgi:multidrug efflux pump subunit AcrB
VTFLSLRADVEDEFQELIDNLPPGYSAFWDGEAKSIRETLASLVPGIAPAVVIMLLIMVALFNEIRPPIIIIFALPFAIIGITSVMLPTQTPFGFMAVLGAMSLVGMQIKNAIVLIDEINLNKTRGLGDYDAVVQAGVSRVRPVVLAALTTVLGVIPLIQDVFWISMAMTIMAGLTFGTLVTMVLIPTLYATFYGIPSPKRGDKTQAPVPRAA